MPRHVVIELELALRKRFHQIDTAARRVHFRPRQHIRRASFQTKPAMDAVEQQLVFDNVSNRGVRH
jgi:hypothetical protein